MSEPTRKSAQSRDFSRVARALPLCALLGCYLFAVACFALKGDLQLNADISSEWLLAQQLNEEGRFFLSLTPNWMYSTELRVVSPVPIYQLALALFDSWHAARTFAAAIFLALCAASLIYMMRGAGAKASAWYAAAVIVLPFSRYYDFLFVYGGFYTMYFCLNCWLLGLVFRLPDAKGRSLLARLACLVVLSLWGGLGGVRMLMVTGAPLLVAAAVLTLRDAMRCTTWAQAIRTASARMLMGALLIAVTMLIGLKVNLTVFTQRYAFQSHANTTATGFQSEALWATWNYLTQFFGGLLPPYTCALLSQRGLMSVCAIVFSILPFAALMGLLCLRSRLSAQGKLMALFAGLACAIGVVINIVTQYYNNVYHIAYFLPGLLVALALVFFCVEQMPFHLPGLRTACAMALVAAFGLQSVTAIRSSWTDHPSGVQQAADWLLEQGIHQGFATFWNASTLTEASDGVIDVWHFIDWNATRPYSWLQDRAHLTSLPEGRVFAYVAAAELAESPPCAREENLAWSCREGNLYVFDDAQTVMDLLLSGNASPAR